MAFDFSNISDEELEAMAAQSAPASEPMPQKPLSEWTDEELEAFASEPNPVPVQSASNPPRMTREERIAQNQRAIETARSQEEPGFLSAAGEAIAEGAKGAARAVKSVGGGIVGMASGAVRLAGTPVRAVTGWEGLHRLADTIDSSYENFGRDALMSEYGENPDGWGYALGRGGEKVAGVAGSLAVLGGVGKAVGAAGTALKMAGHAKTAAAVANTLPLMFGNDAAVRAYDTARANGKDKAQAAALAGLNGAIHFLGFKAFENKALNKMLGMPAEMEAMMPKWANAAAEAGGRSFSSLARGVRNGMIKYTLAERGKGALRAGGIMGLQNFLSDPVMQVAEGASIDDIDFSRTLKAGAEGVGEGALMEGALGAAAVLKSPAEARKFIADKIFRGKGYKVVGPDGKPHDEPGLLNTSEGRMMLMKQNPDATERVLDIVEHGGTPRPAELDAAFLPPDMTAEELKKFASDWRNDLKPYVDEAWAADAPRRDIAPDASATGPSRDILAAGDVQRIENNEQERYNARMTAREEAKAKAGQEAYDQAMLEREEARARQGETSEQKESARNEVGTDEAPAQPEQGEVVAPAAGAEARPVESAEARAEAPDARVVAPPISERVAEKKAEVAARKGVDSQGNPVGVYTPQGVKSSSGETEADYQNWLKRFDLPDTKIRHENWFNQFSKNESVRRDAIDYVRTMERRNGEDNGANAAESVRIDQTGVPDWLDDEGIADIYNAPNFIEGWGSAISAFHRHQVKTDEKLNELRNLFANETNEAKRKKLNNQYKKRINELWEHQGEVQPQDEMRDAVNAIQSREGATSQMKPSQIKAAKEKISPKPTEKPAESAKPVSETPKTEASVTVPAQSGNAAPGISADDFVAAHSTTDAKGKRVANNDIGSQGEITPLPDYAAKKVKPVKPGDATAALKAVGRNASQDDTRIDLKRVHVEGGQMVATDGRRLVVAPAPDGVADGNYDAIGAPIKPTESYVPYPAWRQVVPDLRRHGYRKIGEIANGDAAHGRIAFADETDGKVRRAKGGNLAVLLHVGNAGANPQFVKEVVNTMFALGAERLEVFQAPDYAPVVFKGRNARGEITGVVMPLRVDGKGNAISEKGTHVKLFVDGSNAVSAEGAKSASRMSDAVVEIDATTRESAKKVRLSAEAIADIKDWIAKNPNGNFTHNGFQKIFDAEMKRVKAANGGVNPEVVLPTLDAISVAYHDMKSAKPVEVASRASDANGDWTPPIPALLEKGNEKRFSDGDKVVGWRRIYNPGITTPKTEDVNGVFMGMSPEGEALIRTEKGSYVRVDPRTLKTPEEFAEDAAKNKAQNSAIAKRMTEGVIPKEEIDRLLGMSPEDIAKADIKFEQSAKPIPDGKGKMVKPKAAESDYGVTMFEEPAVDGEGVSYVVKDGPSDAHRMMFKSKAEAEARLAELRAERKAIIESPSATLADGKKVRLLKTDKGWIPYDENYNDLRHGLFKAAKTKAEAIKVAEKGVKWARDVAEENARYMAEAEKPKSDGKGKMVKPEPKSAEGAGAQPPSVPTEPPAAEPKSNRLRRADGTDPLIEKNPAPKTVRKAVDKISLAISNRTGTGVITPEEADGIVRGIVESPETKHNRYRDFFNPLENDAKWHESLGLDAESAKNLRDAFGRVKADADLKKWFPQVDAAVKKANDGRLSKKDAAPLFGKISEGLEKAERMGLSETANRLREAAEVIRPVAETVEQGDVNKFNYSTKGQKLNNRLGGTDKRGGKTVSLDTKNGTVDVRADGKGGTLGGNRHLIIDGVNGDELTVTMKDAAGKTLATRKMNHAQWSALAKGAVATDGDPANPQKGDLIRMSRSDATDAPQSWTPETQKPLERVAHTLRNVVTVGGKRLKVEFLNERPAEADGQTRKSISGIYTGTAADYANRSRQGGVDDGPSLKKIGTGEGSQVYGWGLYGSNQRGVAASYAINPKDRRIRVRVDGKEILGDTPVEKRALITLRVLNGNLEESIAAEENRVAMNETSLEAEYLKTFRGKDLRVEGGGHLYEQTWFTNRAPGDESHLLKWYSDERPRNLLKNIRNNLSPEQVDAFNRAYNKAYRSGPGGRAQAVFNGDVYKILSDILGSPKSASEFLRDKCDIDGVKYPVDSYRGPIRDGDVAGWNYVSFRDDNIRVDHKWTDGELRYMRNADGVTVGEYDAAKGEIRLYPGATVADVVHEFTHPLVDFARAEANAGRGELLSKINQIIDAERATWEQPVREAYKDKSNETILEEIFTHAMGEKGADLFGKSTKTLQGRRWYNRLWEAIKGVWQDFATKMGWNKADLRGLERMSPEDAAQKILSEMAKGRNFGDAVTGGEGTRNAFAGTKGAERLGIGKFADAEQMEKDGASREDIWRKTGWWRGKDGQWRVELPPIAIDGQKLKQLDVNRDNYNFRKRKAQPEYHARLEDLIADKQLVAKLNAAYGTLPHISVVDDVGWALGRFRPDANSIDIHRHMTAAEMRSVVEHELQHFIQHKEGFPEGGDNTGGEYRNLEGEVEARNVQARLGMTPEERAATPPWETEDVPEDRQIVRTDGGIASSVRESRRIEPPRPDDSRIMDDEQTKGEKFTEKFIDSFAPVKSVQGEIGGVKEVTRADGYTDHTKSTDLVAAKEKANGRIEHELRQHQFRIDDINRDLARAALPKQSTEDLVDDFNLYLQCKHAPERNLSVAQDRGDAYTPDYSEGMGQITLPGGNRIGLSENVANRLLKGLRGKYGLKIKMFENAADKVYKMLEADLDRRFDAGRLSAEDYAFYKTRWHGPGGADGKWAHYVPLKTDMERLEPEALNSSTAGMKRNEFMKAQGRGTSDIADSPLAAAVLQTEQGIRGSIRNEVANVEANLVEHAQKQGKPIAEIVPGDEIRRGRTYSFTFADGETVDASGSMRLVENHPEIHLFKRNGKLYAIRYQKGANGRGLAFARAASGENMGRWGSGLEWIPHMTHWMSAMRTQYSPEFTVSNWLADHLEAAQALIGRYGLKEGGKAFAKTVASEIQNWKDLRAYLKDGTANGYIKEFVEGGGLTKGGVASEGFEAETQKIRSKIEQFRREQKQWREMSPADLAKSAGRYVTDFLSFANELAEYSTRTGLYTALRKMRDASGKELVSKADAIKFARDATVNFNRKGTAMPYINGLYMFANASVQGAVRSVQAMRDTHGKELVAALTAIGVAKAVIDNFLGNDDEREAAGGRNARNQSEYDKKHNVGVPIGGGRQIVPLRFRGPYAAIPYLAQTAANVAMGATSPEDGAKTLFRELGDQVTDLVGGNGIMNDRGEFDGALIGQSLAPSVADPIVQLATGKDYKGDERRRKSFDKTMPASSNGKRSTGDWYKVAAQTLNRMSGGNEHRKGLVDVAPEDLQLVLEFLGGAPMRDINNVASSVNNAVQLAAGGTPERTLSQIPFVRRVVREYPESTSRYYDALEDYERDKAEFKKTTPERRKEMKADKPYLFTGKSLLDGQIERIKELMHLERGEVKVGQKWVEPKTPRTEEQKEEWRKKRLALQAQILKRLGK